MMKRRQMGQKYKELRDGDKCSISTSTLTQLPKTKIE